MKLNIKISPCIKRIPGILMLLGLAACSKMDSTYRQFIENGPVIYPGKSDSLLVLSGKNRAKLVWQMSDPSIKECKVFWLNNGIPDSVSVNVGKINGATPISVVIDNLPENSYTFTVLSYDKWGNTSVPTEKIGNVYGENYIKSLNNRQIRSLILSDDATSAQIKWYNPGINEIGTELRYDNTSGIEQRAIVPADQSNWVVADFDYGSEMKFRSLYIPDSAAIDTFYTEFSSVRLPKYSAMLDKALMSEYFLPGDVNGMVYQTKVMSYLWDGDITGGSWYCSATTGVPNKTFAFDLGASASLSSFRIWQRFKDGIANAYASANPRLFEVWGTNETPDADGSWDNWTKLMDCEIIKPSGLPLGTRSAADNAALEDGHEFTFPDDTPRVRYLRFKIKESWDPARVYFFFSELSFYGDPR